MGKIDKITLEKFNKTRSHSKYLCYAPFTSMKISMDGRVSPCCYNKSLDDLYLSKSLSDIWKGDVFNNYRNNIKKGKLPLSCVVCEKSILNNEYNSVKIHQYDNYKVSRLGKLRPRIIEMALSNTCNLECIMCNGRLSSSIRKNREKLPALEEFFDDRFRIELQDYIPYLQEAVFAGGEPFLIPLYYDIWEDIIRLNPTCKISVVTNGTIMNDKIRVLMEKGNFKINLSFDSITKKNYETIRVNANFDKTLANIEYFGSVLKRKGGRLHIPICPLKINRYEIPELVRFCNMRGYSLNFVSMSGAVSHVMSSLNSQELEKLKIFYKTQQFDENDKNSTENIHEFDDLVSRLDNWIKSAIRKENFETNFDLGKSNVSKLKKEFIDNLNKGLKLLFNNNEECKKNKKIALLKFEETMLELPEYFESNHFYTQLLKYSPLVILNALLNHHVSFIVENSKEIFFYPSISDNT